MPETIGFIGLGLMGRPMATNLIKAGHALVVHSSIAPGVARRLAAKAKSLGAQMLDAPVSGGEIGAVGGTLSIMVGGDADAFDTVKPILDVMGNPEKVVRIGEAGAGQLCKVCNQMVIAGTLQLGCAPACHRADGGRWRRRRLFGDGEGGSRSRQVGLREVTMKKFAAVLCLVSCPALAFGEVAKV